MKRGFADKVFALAAIAVVAANWTNATSAAESTSSTTSTVTNVTKKPRAKKVRTYDAASATTTRKTTTRVKGTSYARVLHGIQNGPNVDVYVDGKKVLSNAAYKSLSDYVALPTGKHVFKITKVGQSDALVSADLPHAKDKFYTVAAYGTPEKPLLLRVNEATGKLVEGKARVYVVHLAQAPVVDVTTPSERNKKTGYANFLKAIPSGAARAKTVSPGDVKLQVRADGKVIKEVDAKIEANHRYSVFAVGNANSLDLIVKQAMDVKTPDVKTIPANSAAQASVATS